MLLQLPQKPWQGSSALWKHHMKRSTWKHYYMRSLHEKKSSVKIPVAGVYLLVEKIAFIRFIMVDVAKDFDITNRSWFHRQTQRICHQHLKDT